MDDQRKTLGLIIIGIILLAIILAFIFSANFRKDVIASEGEAKVLGLINVKGVIIVLLTAIFAGAFVYILQLDLKPDSSTPNTIISPAVATPNSRLSASVNKTDLAKWQIKKDAFDLGYVNLKSNQAVLFYDNEAVQEYQIKKEYKIGNLAFNFIIDSIYRTETKQGTQYNYLIRFGEGDNGNISWQTTATTFVKTENGKLNPKKPLAKIQDNKWESVYYLDFGIGEPLRDINELDATNVKFTGVNFVNIKVLETKVN